MTRRQWLAANAGVAGAAAQLAATPLSVRDRIRGPIVSIPTPFTRDGAVDHAGVEKMIARGLAAGITCYELTAGDSRYNVLTVDEIKELTRVCARAVKDKGTFIAATGAWPTAQAVEYAAFAEKTGADAVQVLVPQGQDDGLFEHYRTVARATSLGIVLHGNLPLPLIERLIAIPSVIAMKEDVTEKYYFDIQRKFGKRLAIFCGGQKWRFLVGRRYGSVGYLSTFGTFAPQVAMRFWKAVERRDDAEINDIVLKYDQPMFDLFLSGPRTFHAWWRGTLELFGVAGRYQRAPEDSCTAADMQKLAGFWKGLGLL